MEGSGLERITVAISGLTAEGGGTLAAEQALLRLPGVSQVFVNAATEMAYVEYNPARTGHTQIIAAIEGTGLGAGELNVRSLCCLPAATPQRQETPSSTSEFDAACMHAPASSPASSPAELPAILADAPHALSVRGARIIASGASASGARHLTVTPVSTAYDSERFSGTRAKRLPLLAGAIALALMLGALILLMGSRGAMPENTITVEAGASGFSPLAVVIPAGKPATLLIRNADQDLGHASGTGTAHQFTISELGIDVKLQPGQSTLVNLPPLAPATYHYYCDICCGGSNDPSMQGALIIH